jgi:hypothetical protein
VKTNKPVFELEDNIEDVGFMPTQSGTKQKEPLYTAIAEKLSKQKPGGKGFLVPLSMAKLRKKKSLNDPTLTDFAGNIKAALDKKDDGRWKGKYECKPAASDEPQVLIRLKKEAPPKEADSE